MYAKVRTLLIAEETFRGASLIVCTLGVL